jgi:hypothetical protein
METSKLKRFEMLASEDWFEAVDGWRARQRGLPSRAEAIRRLVELALNKEKQ